MAPLEQLSRRCSASVAVQVTVACPIVNGDPAAGEQLVVTGDWPLRTDGAVNGTGVAAPSSDCAVCAAGQVILGGSAVTGTGIGTCVGVDGLAHAATIIALAIAQPRRTAHLHTKRH